MSEVTTPEDIVTSLVTGYASPRETLARDPQEVEPQGITLPRSWEEYRQDAEHAPHAALVRALETALADTIVTPQRYAELMHLLDAWFIADRYVIRQEELRAAWEVESSALGMRKTT